MHTTTQVTTQTLVRHAAPSKSTPASILESLAPDDAKHFLWGYAWSQLEDKNISAPGLPVYCLVLSTIFSALEDGEIITSVVSLAEELEYSDNYIRKTLKGLSEQGFIHRRREGAGSYLCELGSQFHKRIDNKTEIIKLGKQISRKIEEVKRAQGGRKNKRGRKIIKSKKDKIESFQAVGELSARRYDALSEDTFKNLTLLFCNLIHIQDGSKLVSFMPAWLGLISGLKVLQELEHNDSLVKLKSMIADAEKLLQETVSQDIEADDLYHELHLFVGNLYSLRQARIDTYHTIQTRKSHTKENYDD